MNGTDLKNARRAMYKENNRWSVKLVPVPKDDWPEGMPETTMEVWRSRDFLVQLHKLPNDIIQAIVMRTSLDQAGRMIGGINHSKMQKIKREIGLADRAAVEIYPPDQHLIDSGGARFMWLLPEPIPFMFTKPPLQRSIAMIHDPESAKNQDMARLLQPSRILAPY